VDDLFFLVKPLLLSSGIGFTIIADGREAGHSLTALSDVDNGHQDRQAERNQRALMQQGVADRIDQQSIDVASSRELARACSCAFSVLETVR
jgi:hypothetical protein